MVIDIHLSIVKLYRMRASVFPVITKRELEVLGRVQAGLKSAEIAKELEISINTVSNHRKSILSKTRSSNAWEMVQWGIKHGLLE